MIRTLTLLLRPAAPVVVCDVRRGFHVGPFTGTPIPSISRCGFCRSVTGRTLR